MRRICIPAKMESERKKRKMGNEKEEEDDDEEEEEEKVEKFFALIRSTREMREHLRNVPNGSEEEQEKMKKKKNKEAEEKAAWNPTFQPEDFMQMQMQEQQHDNNSNSNPPLNEAGPSSKTAQAQEHATKEGGEEEEKEDSTGLDLKLSL